MMLAERVKTAAKKSPGYIRVIGAYTKPFAIL
jgi:hypothetical protein